MIDIVFCIDENYRDIVKVVMKSILANTKSKIKFHIIGIDIDGCECYDRVDMSNLKVYTNPDNRITECASYRLYVPDIIKADKCIYLDSDLIVLDDIRKLYDYDVKYLAGVLDPMYQMQADKNKLTHGYINSGVMVMNLKNLRKIDYWQRIHAAQERALNLSLVDQDTINIAFGDLIEHLPERWNVYAKVYPQTTVKMYNARFNPAIIHWAGAEKPYNVWNGKMWYNYSE